MLGAVEGGDFLVHSAQAVCDGAAHADEQPSSSTWILVDVAFKAFAINSPYLREFHGGDGGAGDIGIEEIDLADSLAFLNGAEQNLVTAAHGGGVKFAGGDKEKAVLLHAFFNEVLARLHREKFTVAAKDIAILLAEGFENALGGELGRGE